MTRPFVEEAPNGRLKLQRGGGLRSIKSVYGLLAYTDEYDMRTRRYGCLH